ncbi:hypothetical protein ACWCPF_28575 [Streptomyces sp. NPDC001858]
MTRTGHPDSDRPIPAPGSRAPSVPECPVRQDRLGTEHFQQLETLGLATEDFVVAGSAPLFIHGLRDQVTDLDIVARGAAWNHAVSRSRSLSLPGPRHAPYGDVLSVHFFGSRIEVLNAWFPFLLGTVDDLIRAAEDYQGINFLTLHDTLRWKRHLGRPKDREDVRRIQGVYRPRLRAGREPGIALKNVDRKNVDRKDSDRKDADRMTVRGGSSVERPPAVQVRETTPQPWSRSAPSSRLRS